MIPVNFRVVLLDIGSFLVEVDGAGRPELYLRRPTGGDPRGFEVSLHTSWL